MTTSAGSQTIVIVFTSEAKLFTYFFEASDTQSSGFHVLPCTNSLVCGLTRGCEPSSHGTRDGRGCVSDALDHHEARQVHEREVHDDVERNLLDDVDLARGVLELGGERWVAGEALHGREPDLLFRGVGGVSLVAGSVVPAVLGVVPVTLYMFTCGARMCVPCRVSPGDRAAQQRGRCARRAAGTHLDPVLDAAKVDGTKDDKDHVSLPVHLAERLLLHGALRDEVCEARLQRRDEDVRREGVALHQ